MAGSSNVLLSASTRIKDYEYLYASDTNVSAFVSVKLSGSRNYPLWKAQMLCLLDSKNMCGIVDAAFVGPKDSGTGITRRYDSLVRGWIFGSVTEDVLGDVFNLGSAKAVWEKLKSIHDHTVCSPEVGDSKKMEWFILWDEIDKLKSSHIHHPYFSRSQLYCQRLLKVEKWVKDIAESCSITTALITAIVFAAGITVPDVSNREMRTSFFEKETLIIIFGISDAISLFTSTMALLVFLCILTARFDEKDFLVGLPRRLFIGLFFLLLSTTAMMVASSATFFLVFCDQKPWMLAPICGLAFILIAFVTLQFPVIVDLFKTYLGIFGKHRKNHTGRDFKSSNILHEATFTQEIKEDGSTILHMTAETGKKMGNSSNPLQSGSAGIQDIEYLYASNTKVSSFVSVKLSGSCNYLLWKAQMIYLLDSKNLSGVVDSAFGGPRDSGTETMRQYNSLVKGWIFGSVSEDVLVDVFHLSSAKAVWEKLKFIYEPTLGLPKVGNIKKKEWSIVPMSHRDNLCDENKTAETGSNENDVGNYDLFNDDDDVDEDELLFGASRSIRLDHKHVTTLIQGTIGYMNPEYFHISQPNVRSDVYSFGVGLFEIITWKKPIRVYRTTSEKNLSAYFVNSLKENPEELQEEEVNFLGKFSHPNLVNRVRYCWEDREFLLVNEYRQKGSFENHLFRSPKPVPWSTRIKIAIEVAQALAFLHTPKETAIYRDLKSSNILLDRDFNVKLSDFGLSKSGIAKPFPTGEIFLLFGHIKKRKEGDDAKMVLEMVCDEIKQVGQLSYSSSLLLQPILEAACQNTMQVVYEILTRSHEAIQSEDKKGYDIIQLTKVRHSKKVYNFIYDIVDCKNLYRTVKDSSKNNIVHMV